MANGETKEDGLLILWWRDWQVGAALLAAPVVWGILLWWLRPEWNPNWPMAFPVRFLILAAAYPIVEEIIFRGALQGWFSNFSWGAKKFGLVSGANIVTSIIFAGSHGFNHPPLMAAAVFIPSLTFGYFRDRHEGLAVPITLHCFYNAGWFWIFK